MPPLAATDSAVRKAKYEGSDTKAEYRIIGNPGLVLVLGKPNAAERSRKNWWFYSSEVINGKQKHRKFKIGMYPAVGLAEARYMVTKAQAAIGSGRRPEEAIHGPSKQVSPSLMFADLAQEYFAMRPDVVSMPEVKREFGVDVLPAIGTKAASDVTAADIDAIATAIFERGSPAMALELSSTPRRFLTLCCSRPLPWQRSIGSKTIRPSALVGVDVVVPAALVPQKPGSAFLMTKNSVRGYRRWGRASSAKISSWR